jgi:hypothetical protein
MFGQLRSMIPTTCLAICVNYADHLPIVVAPQVDLRQSLEMLRKEVIDTSSHLILLINYKLCSFIFHAWQCM